jgi:hypothetical protein
MIEMASDGDVKFTILMVMCMLFHWWLYARRQFFSFVTRNMCMRFVTDLHMLVNI